MSGGKNTLSINDVPRLKKGVDLTGLNLNATEGFILSQVDGKLSIGDLRAVCGLSEAKLFPIIEKLVNLGSVELSGKSGEANATSRATGGWKISEDMPFEDRVRSLYLELENLNYYQLLGIDRAASAEDIKKAYHRMTREYHPDKLFRDGDVELRGRLQNIFAEITQAYKTLSNPDLKKEYDASLKSWEAEAAESGRSDGGKPGKPRPPKPPEKPTAAPAKNPFMDNVLKAKRLFEGALIEMKRKNYAAARQNLRLAATLDPFNSRYKEAMLKLDKLENIGQARNYYETGLVYESEGKFKEAMRLYREASLLDDSNYLYYYHLAKLTFEYEKKIEAAKKLVQKAIELNSKYPEGYLLLGRIFAESGQTSAAIAKFQQGLEIAPSHKELGKELKRAKKMKK